MKVVILQPSYIPWRGYFDQIYQADLFVFYDNVQYDKRGWRNRNQIKTANKKQWLTIPVNSKGAQIKHTPINQIPIIWDAREMGIRKTHFMRSSELEGISGEKTDRLISVLQAVGASAYLSGPSARDYIEDDKFKEALVKIKFLDSEFYSSY